MPRERNTMTLLQAILICGVLGMIGGALGWLLAHTL